MKEISKQPQRLELHQIKRPYSQGRVWDAHQLTKLMGGMSSNGLRVPLVVIEQKDSYVLLDGYQRFEAASQCGWDEIDVEVWDCDAAQGIERLLAMTGAREWTPVEEGYLIKELIRVRSYSRREVALQLGKTTSWVARRLELVESLPTEVLSAVKRGELSSWSASRVIAPLARANSEHAKSLLGWINKDAPSTRQLEALYKQYQESTGAQRANLIANPGLFVKAWDAKKNHQQARQLGTGPEEAALQTIRQLQRLMRKLKRQTRDLLSCGDVTALRSVDLAMVRADQTWRDFNEELRSQYDTIREEGGDPSAPCAGTLDSGDQPQPPHGASDSAPLPEEPHPQRTEKLKTQRSGPGPDSRTLPNVSRQRGTRSRNARGKARHEPGLLNPNPSRARGSPS